MIKSESIEQIGTALAIAQGEYEQILKTEKGGFKGKYETLEAVLAATRPALSKNGICFVQFAEVLENLRVEVTTMLIHKSGQYIGSKLSIKPVSDLAQAIGSAITYAKRYAGKALLGVDAENDDDGTAASDTKTIEAENQRLKEKIDALTNQCKEAGKKIEDLHRQAKELQKPPRIFSSKNIQQVAGLEKVLENEKIAADMKIKIMEYMEGKNIDTELSPYIKRIKAGEIS